MLDLEKISSLMCQFCKLVGKTTAYNYKNKHVSNIYYKNGLNNKLDAQFSCQDVTCFDQTFSKKAIF